MAAAKTAFLNALTAPPNSAAAVPASVTAVNQTSAALVQAAGKIGAYGIDVTNDIYDQLQSFLSTTNKLGVTVASSANSLNWATNAFIKIINNLYGKTSVDTPDIAVAQRYLTGKLSVYTPVNFADDATTLGDNLVAYQTTITASIPTIKSNITKMKQAVSDAQKELDKAHDAIHTANVLRGVSQLVSALCDAGAIVAATKTAQADRVRENANVQNEGGHQRLEDEEERAARAARIQKSGVVYLVGSGFGKIFGGVFDAIAQGVSSTVPGQDALSTLRTQIDQLETYSIPLYEDHILPAMSSLVPTVNTAVVQLRTISNSWTALSNDLSKLATNFTTWKADSSYSLNEFKTSINGLLPAWNTLAAATAAVTPNTLTTPRSLAFVASPRVLEAFSSTTTNDVLRVQTAPLLDALTPLKAEDTGLVSLPQAKASFTYAVNQLLPLASTSAALSDVVPLAKNANEISVDIDSTLATVAYFIDKIDSYTTNQQLQTKPDAVLRTLGRKAELLSTSLADQVQLIKTAAATAKTSATNSSAVVAKQTTALTAAIKELEDQKKQVEQIVDEEKKKQASKKQKLSASFKKMLTDGLFSEATLKFIALLLGIDSATDTDALNNAQTSLDNISTAIDKAKDESTNLQSSSPLLEQANAAFSTVQIGFSGLAEGFKATGAKLIALSGTIKPNLVDWDLFDQQLPLVMSGWKGFYNSISRTQDYTPVAPIPSARLVVRRDANNLITSKRYPTTSDSLVSRTVTPLSRTLATAAPTTLSGEAPKATDTATARSNIKEALGPAAGATTAVQDITDNIATVYAKVKDMRKQLAPSQWAADLVTKVTDFEKEYNALEVSARTQAGQIYWFGQKNIKVLGDLKAQAQAGTLTVTEFQKLIRYLEAKVAAFVTSSGQMTLEHKNLKTSMASISGALTEALATLTDLIPKMQARLTQAQSDLDKEKDKLKSAAIVRAVGTSISALGQGGGIFAVVKGNMKLGYFSAAATIVGGIMNLVAGCIDGDPNKVAELTASVAALNAQIPDMQLAKDAIAPCLADAADIQTALTSMSDSWQIVNNNLSNIDRDYKFWLTNGFVLDDFLFDVDDDVTAWNNVCTLLYKLALQGGDQGDPSPQPRMLAMRRAALPFPAATVSNSLFDINTSIAKALSAVVHAAAAASNQETPVTAFNKIVVQMLDLSNQTSTKATTYAHQAIDGANAQTGPGPQFDTYIQSLQALGEEAFKLSTNLDVTSRNAATTGGVAVAELDRESTLLAQKIKEVNDKIYDAEHLSFWDKLRGFFEHFGDSIKGIFSGDIKKTFEGIGTIIAPFSAGITIAAINTVDDAKRLVQQLQDVQKQLIAQSAQTATLLTLVKNQTGATQGVTNAVTALRNTTQNLKLDINPAELWQDFLFDKPDILSNANIVIRQSQHLHDTTAAFPR